MAWPSNEVISAKQVRTADLHLPNQAHLGRRVDEPGCPEMPWSPSGRSLTQDHLLQKAPPGTYRATLDVLMELAWFVAKLLLAKKRQQRGTRVAAGRWPAFSRWCWACGASAT